MRPPSQTFTLTLAATVTSVTDGSLRVRVNTLRAHPDASYAAQAQPAADAHRP